MMHHSGISGLFQGIIFCTTAVSSLEPLVTGDVSNRQNVNIDIINPEIICGVVQRHESARHTWLMLTLMSIDWTSRLGWLRRRISLELGVLRFV